MPWVVECLSKTYSTIHGFIFVKVMKMSKNFGYFVLGTGVGMFIASFLYEKELERPIGEIEEYIPENHVVVPESNDIFENDGETMDFGYMSDSNSFKDDVLDQKRKFEENRRNEPNKNQTIRYSKMYDEDEYRVYRDGKKAMTDILNNVSDGVEDSPSDDEPDDYAEEYEFDDNSDAELVRERVEEEIEVYLGDNPQDFATLIYYAGDGTLTDDREQIVPEIEDVVGTVAIQRLLEGGPGAENGVIFIRNLRTAINYELVLDSGSYSETVLGIFESRLNKGAGGDVNRR